MNGIERPVYRVLGVRRYAAPLILPLNEFFQAGDHCVDALSLLLYGKARCRNAVGVSVFVESVFETPRGMQHLIKLAAGLMLLVEKRDERRAKRYGAEQDVLEAVENELAVKDRDVAKKNPSCNRRFVLYDRCRRETPVAISGHWTARPQCAYLSIFLRTKVTA